MPRVHHVKKARKARPAYGIEVGDSYYWWERKTGPTSSVKGFSKTPPKRSQLTGSPFLAALYDLEDDMDAIQNTTSPDDLESVRDDFAQRIRDMIDECQGSLDNMPESLQSSPTGELLQERIDNLESWATEIESIDLDPPDDLDDEEEDDGAWVGEKIQEMINANPGIG